MPSRYLALAAGAIALAGIAAPAFAQLTSSTSADLTVSLSGPTDLQGDPVLSFGDAPSFTPGMGTYQVTVTNNGPQIAYTVQVVATLPPGTNIDPASQWTGCDSIATTVAANDTCVFNQVELTNPPNTPPATATFSIDVAMPTPLPTACPTVTADTLVVVSPAGTTLDSTGAIIPTTVDPGSSNNSASVTNPIAPAAILVINLDGWSGGYEQVVGAEGMLVVYNGTVQNLGPCVAPAVGIADNNSGQLNWVKNIGFLDNTQECAGSNCVVGDLAPGQTAEWTAEYTIAQLGSDIQNAVPILWFTSAPTAQVFIPIATPASTVNVDDPGNPQGTDLSTSTTTAFSVKGPNSSCSTFGSGGALGLVALLGLALRRRRPRAHR